ncbi:MAG: hypothetical protein FJ221_04370 [Lentisphaerae bacterium]|nr:hypothetical protein [Lentisphaerota bacterium]
MSVYCPDCGHLLQNSAGQDAVDLSCGRCRRPLGDPNHTPVPALAERGLKILLTGSIPMAVAWVLAGALLVALAACLAFPVAVHRALASLGPAVAGGGGAGIPLRLVEILSVVIGLCALFVLVRLPTRRRSQGRM